MQYRLVGDVASETGGGEARGPGGLRRPFAIPESPPEQWVPRSSRGEGTPRMKPGNVSRRPRAYGSLEDGQVTKPTRGHIVGPMAVTDRQERAADVA